VLLDIESMSELRKLTGQLHTVNSVASSPDGKHLAIAGDGTHIKVVVARNSFQRDGK